MTSAEEKRFVELLRRGERLAFRELVNRFSRYVYNLCFRILGNTGDAEDVTQEVFLTIFKGVDSFRGDCKLSTWIYRITYNHCLSTLKYKERRMSSRHSSLEHVRESWAGQQGSIELSSPLEILIGKETEDNIQAALSKLSPEYRMVVVLRDIQSLSYEEISEITGLADGTVKSRLHRGRLQLAEMLEPHVGNPQGAPQDKSQS